MLDLLTNAENPTPKSYYKSPVSETLDDFIMSSTFYSPHYKEMRSHLKKAVSSCEAADASDDGGVKHPKHFSVEKINNMTVIKLTAVDEMVSHTGEACSYFVLHWNIV